MTVKMRYLENKLFTKESIEVKSLNYTEVINVTSNTQSSENHSADDILKTDQNAPKKNLEWKYGHFHFKSVLKINFRLREVVKLRIHVYANMCIFSLTTFRSRKLIFKADLK